MSTNEDKLDVLKERRELYNLQKERVRLDTDIEKRLKKTFPSLSQDIRLLKEMLDDLQQAQEETETMPSAMKGF